MIREDLGGRRPVKNTKFILPGVYELPEYERSTVMDTLSPVARHIYYKMSPQAVGRYVSPDQPEIIALRLLDFLSSKQGYIRRKGRTFRNETVYRQTLPLLIEPITRSEPVVLSSLCLCTTLANTKYGGESPYPHMASYIALENMQKIAKAARQIYPPGVRFVLGFEGTLFRSLYFHSETVVRNAFSILQELNSLVHQNFSDAAQPNPVEVVDAVWMIEQSFGSYSAFLKQVEEQKQHIDPELLLDWQAWYRETASAMYFPSRKAQNNFIEEKAKWREAVHQLKYVGGQGGKGFMRFAEGVIPFTSSGRQTNMLALQLVPKSSYLPHQRVITYDPGTENWHMMAYCDLKDGDSTYAPRFVRDYLYPFYFEKQTADTSF